MLAFAGEFDAVMFAFPRERIDGKFLHGHALATCPAEAQAQLSNGEQIGFVEVGPDERFTGSAGRGSTGGVGIGHRRTIIGRGDAQRIIESRWPIGIVNTPKSLPCDRLTIRQGSVLL